MASINDSADYASCESIVSGKGRVSVLKKSSLSSLNSVVSTNSCLRPVMTEGKQSTRREKHGVSFAVPFTDSNDFSRGRLSSDSSSQYCTRRYSSSRTHDKIPLVPHSMSNQTCDSVVNRSCENFNMDEFGIILGASSNDSIVSGTYSYDAVLSASTDSEVGNMRRYSPIIPKKSLEVDPWRVEDVTVSNERISTLTRKDTPPPKPILPNTTEKDLREFIKRKHTRNISMSTQTLRRSRGISSENLVSQTDSNEASMSSLDHGLPFLVDDPNEVRYENITTISAAINSNNSRSSDDFS